ncbi:proteoglycan 4-like, partial [Nylanderia fulva]|uniref:proteoglycan 4-like n=1 Tax=Nylanderia fulva TaxID=613905 RepID=UPI0010FB8959
KDNTHSVCLTLTIHLQGPQKHRHHSPPASQETQTPVNDRHFPNDSKIHDNEIQPQPPPSTPTKARGATSPSSVVTPRAVRSGLARSPEATTPRRQLAQETESLTPANGQTSKTPPPDVTNNRNTPKGRSPTSPRPPSSLRVKSAGDKSSPSTPNKTSPGTPRKTPSPRELRLPKLASSPISQEASPATPETQSKITLPKLIEPSSKAARMAY